VAAGCHPRASTPPTKFQLEEGPRPPGVVHTVKPGETLWRISRTYGVDERELAELNDLLSPSQIQVGQGLFIPGATAVLEVPPPGAHPVASAPGPEEEQKAFRRTTQLRWPLQGVLMSRFGVRGGEHHDGIDIAAPEGTAIFAAGSGVVLFAGAQRGYGNLAVIDHGGGLATVYAHCSEVLVHTGQNISSAQTIAKVGRTGRATGPHLHFEVRLHAQPRNPLFYLPEP
jgi:murein DD-endopeptidase MepM/ murein hydrolase activator NlpD